VISGFRREVDMRSFEVLRGIEWYSFTDVSGQRVGPIFKDPGFIGAPDP
jgi:hypothetical protein